MREREREREIYENPTVPSRVYFVLSDGVSRCNHGVTEAARSASALERNYKTLIERRRVHAASQWVHSRGRGDRPGAL